MVKELQAARALRETGKIGVGNDDSIFSQQRAEGADASPPKKARKLTKEEQITKMKEEMER